MTDAAHQHRSRRTSSKTSPRSSSELAREGEVVAARRLGGHAAGSSSRDLDMLDEVAIGDAEVNAMQMAIDDRAFKLLALHQPVAIDLRMIVAAIKINADLERIGDLAVNIAEAARRYFSTGAVAEQQLLPRMSEIARGDARRCAERVRHQQPRHRAGGARTRRHARFVARPGQSRGSSISCGTTPDALTSALELMLIARHLERIGDHATNIAEDVFFVVAGEDIRHQMFGIPEAKDN